jgi:flagellar biosynthesis protein FlhB
MADSSKTEKATPQKRKKAREQGQVARSRELSSALAWGGALVLVTWQIPDVARQWRGLMRASLDLSVSQSITPGGPILFWMGCSVLRWIVPVALTAWVFSLSGGLAQGGLVFAPKALELKPERMSPAGKVKQMFSLAGLSGILKSLLPFSAIVWIGISTISKHWDAVVHSSDLGVPAFAAFLLGAIGELIWKCGLVLLAWAGFDYMLIRQKHEGDLKMSHQDLKDEAKQAEGSPLIKGRIRRLQRSMRRRQMLRDTEKASVVITNPTHFAIALRYEMPMEAPIVIAKGRDLLAQEIKEVARWHEIPVLENPPLAQALYRTVQLGHPIPAALYAAVAEILAFVFRAQARARQQAKEGPVR